MKKYPVLKKVIIMMTPLLVSGSLLAAPGTLDQAPLYVGPAVEPNIVILSDDSGSMDWEVMTRAWDNNALFTGTQPDGSTPGGSGNVKHRDSDDNGTANCGFGNGTFFGYLYGVEFGSNTYNDDASDCNTADDEAWRFRNSDFNPLYFNPAKTYKPWAGVDITDTPYTDISITNAPDNPYDPGEWIDLTQHNSNWNGGVDRATSDRDSDGHPDGFRYYTWNDADADGRFDDGEETEFLIKDQDATTQQNFANWFTYHRSREFIAKYAFSKAVEGMTGIRLGYGTINNNDNVNIPVASMNIDPSVGNKKAFYDKLFETDSVDGTPLRTKLRDVGRYYECVANNFYGVSGADCPILPLADYGQCQKNFTILMTDGFYNGDDPFINENHDGGTSDSDYDGADYADNLDDTLADVAMYYYERDLSNLADEVPPSGIDTAPHQHMTTFTVAFGVTGDLDPDGTKTPADATDTDPADPAFNWPTAIATDDFAPKIDDLWHTAFNGRGAFFSAQDPDALIAAIESAVEAASKGTSSSAAVAFNTTTLDTGSVIYQALFNPSEDWKGEMIATRLNADGTIANTPLWNAGNQLNNQTHSNRQIITYKVDSGTPANSTGIPFRVLTDLPTTQQADLNTGPAAVDTNGQARLDYLRGDRANESTGLLFRDRTNALGDIVHSNPVYVGKPQMSYPDRADFGDGLYSTFKSANASRTGIVYIGANDGMLHGFHEDTGNEIFAYIPNKLFSNAAGEGLHYLTDPGYSHRYYVDLSPTIADAYYTHNSAAAWRTVLVGGLRAGGRGLFALDISNPTTLANAENNAASIALWEFTDADDSDLGYTMSKPTIAPVADGNNDVKWAVIVGNGYNGSGDGEAKLFIIYLDGGLDGVWTAGTDYLEITTGVGTVGSPNGLSTPALVDITGDGVVDRVYAGDLEGNLWAFDLTATNDNNWDVAYSQGNTPKPLFSATDSGGNPQPITSKPILANQLQDVAGSPAPDLMIFFGTGQYIVNGDKTSTGTQTFYGIWDDGTDERTRSHLIEQTMTVATTVHAATSTITTTRTMSDNNVNYSSKHGWFIDLPTSGERVVVNPKIRGKFVFFNTLIPGTELCVPQGSGWLMAVNQENGGEPDQTIFDTNNDGVIDANDKVGGHNPSGILLDGIPAGSNFLGDVMYTPDDEGNIDARRISVGGAGGGGRLSWQEITQ